MLSMFLRVVPHLPPSYLNSDAFSTLQQEDHPFYPKSPLQTAAHHTPATSTCILSVTREGFLEDRESQMIEEPIHSESWISLSYLAHSGASSVFSK